MQNFRGKTLATAYSARGSDYAGVSTPLTWREVHAGIDARDFTLTTVPGRVRRGGGPWARPPAAAGARPPAAPPAPTPAREKRRKNEDPTRGAPPIAPGAA